MTDMSRKITESLGSHRTGRGVEESGRRVPKNLDATYQSSPLLSDKPTSNSQERS